MAPVLLDSSFLIDLEREVEAGIAGPAIAWLRKNRAGPQRPLLVSCVSAAEFLEGCDHPRTGMQFICRYISRASGFSTPRSARNFNGERDGQANGSVKTMLGSSRSRNAPGLLLLGAIAKLFVVFVIATKKLTFLAEHTNRRCRGRRIYRSVWPALRGLGN